MGKKAQSAKKPALNGQNGHAVAKPVRRVAQKNAPAKSPGTAPEAAAKLPAKAPARRTIKTKAASEVTAQRLPSEAPAAKASLARKTAGKKRSVAVSAPPATSTAPDIPVPVPTAPAASSPAVSANTVPARIITSDEIALRAYFISEKRRLEGLPGDEAGDWLEAERQLKAELEA